MASVTTLSAHDATTLSLLFDPESSPSCNTASISTSLPHDPHYSSETLPSLQSAERRAIALAESSPKDALPILDDLLEAHPYYASGFNNRAQLRRILSYPPADIRADLEKAISLARPMNKLDLVSPSQARVLSNAYTQLGAVLLREGKEEEAGGMFQEGAWYGGDVARMMAVKLNPVARLCGVIVREAMKEEMRVNCVR